MKTRLTLRIDDRLIQQAKAYAQRSGRSLSELVADFFLRFEPPATEALRPRPPAVRSLAGALAGHELDREDHSLHLIAKHR